MNEMLNVNFDDQVDLSKVGNTGYQLECNPCSDCACGSDCVCPDDCACGSDCGSDD